jgi:hypothetical protein
MFATYFRRVLCVSAALVLTGGAITVAAHAQTATGGKMDSKMSSDKKGTMSSSKMGSTMAGPVYVCAKCKTYMSPDAAKKANYKDPMGHKMTKMSKAPAGYMDASKMSGKMDKMGGSTDSKMKMQDKKMSPSKM